jgi:transcriptional regulator with XRE-family HTH domain
MTQYQLAVKAGVAPATVSSIERGKHQARLTVIRRLSDALGVEPSTVDEFRPSLGLPPAE